jgi:hypothetical protein
MEQTPNLTEVLGLLIQKYIKRNQIINRIGNIQPIAKKAKLSEAKNNNNMMLLRLNL